MNLLVDQERPVTLVKAGRSVHELVKRGENSFQRSRPSQRRREHLERSQDKTAWISAFAAQNALPYGRIKLVPSKVARKVADKKTFRAKPAIAGATTRYDLPGTRGESGTSEEIKQLVSELGYTIPVQE